MRFDYAHPSDMVSIPADIVVILAGSALYWR